MRSRDPAPADRSPRSAGRGTSSKEYRKLGIGVVAITLGLGVFMPLLGISIVALLVLDFVIVKRIAPLATRARCDVMLPSRALDRSPAANSPSNTHDRRTR